MHAGYVMLQTRTHNVILTAFPRQQLLHARVLILTLYVHRLFCYVSPNLSIPSVMDLNNYIISFKHQRWLANNKQLSRARH